MVPSIDIKMWDYFWLPQWILKCGTICGFLTRHLDVGLFMVPSMDIEIWDYLWFLQWTLRSGTIYGSFKGH